MRIFKILLIAMLFVGLTSTDVLSQFRFPPPSPYSVVTQQVGYTTVKIEYSRPSMRQRTIFGGLVPFGEVWRTGANASTKISFNSDVTIEGKKLPHGTYSLLTIPREDSWTIIFNTDETLRGTGNYNVGKDQLRVEVPTNRIDCHFETFLIDVGELTQNSATVQMIWENTIVKFNIGTYTDAEIMAKIDEALDDPLTKLASTYYSSANYYLEHHKDMDKALEWSDEAIKLDPSNARYVLLKSKILAEQQDFKQAVMEAKKAKSMAMEQKNDNLSDSIGKLIDKWKSMKPN